MVECCTGLRICWWGHHCYHSQTGFRDWVGAQRLNRYALRQETQVGFGLPWGWHLLLKRPCYTSSPKLLFWTFCSQIIVDGRVGSYLHPFTAVWLLCRGQMWPWRPSWFGSFLWAHAFSGDKKGKGLCMVPTSPMIFGTHRSDLHVPQLRGQFHAPCK